MTPPTIPPGIGIDVLSPNGLDEGSRPVTLVDLAGLKLKRLALPAGKSLPDHRAPGDIVVHCLAGRLEFTCLGNSVELNPGQLLCLPAGEIHSVLAIEDSTFLLTVGRSPDR